MKVLVLSCNTGEGHNSAARAVREEFCRRGTPCDMEDALGIVGAPNSRAASATYGSIITHTPRLFGAIYRAGELYNSTGIQSPVYYVNAAHAKKLGAFIEAGGYTHVVATHLFPMETLTRMKKTGALHVPAYGVLTDYTRIPFWDETDLDAWFLPHAEVKNDCIRAGMPSERLYVTGLPVSARFSAKVTKAEARAALGMGADVRNILVMTGGVGCGNAPLLIAALLREIPADVTLNVLAGRNAEMKETLDTLYGAGGRVTALPFTDRVDLYMHACDMVITKPGGISTTEAAASRTPLIHTEAIPGCETKNAELFERLGMSMWAKSETEAARCAALLLDDPARAARMTAAQAANIDANGAANVADLVERL